VEWRTNPRSLARDLTRIERLAALCRKNFNKPLSLDAHSESATYPCTWNSIVRSIMATGHISTKMPCLSLHSPLGLTCSAHLVVIVDNSSEFWHRGDPQVSSSSIAKVGISIDRHPSTHASMLSSGSQTHSSLWSMGITFLCSRPTGIEV
jgi:hypothetical protein